ncbi:MAG TPA: hypothetical protein VH640_19405 [Bryobacteraceae bacterium]|jgi:hypothetical protein
MKILTGSLAAMAVLLGLGAMGGIWEGGPAAAVVHAADGGPSTPAASPLSLPVTATVNQPVQVTQGGIVSGPANFVLYTVPKGKRLIVEHFSSEAGMQTGTTVNRYILGVANDPNNPGTVSFNHFIAPSFSSPCGTCVAGQVEVVASQPIRMYVEAGQALVVAVTFSGPVGANAFVFLSASGYLVNA